MKSTGVIADDIKLNTTTPNELSQYDKQFVCQRCNIGLVHKSSVSTLGLLFQISGCECTIANRHVIVRDIRQGNKPIIQCKGTRNTQTSLIQTLIYRYIYDISNFYHSICKIIGKSNIMTELDLIIPEDSLENHQKDRQAAIKEFELLNEDPAGLDSSINSLWSMLKGDIIAIDHLILKNQCEKQLYSFKIWFMQVVTKSFMILSQSILSYLSQHEGKAETMMISSQTFAQKLQKCSDELNQLAQNVLEGKYFRKQDDKYISQLITTISDEEMTYLEFKDVVVNNMEPINKLFNIIIGNISNSYQDTITRYGLAIYDTAEHDQSSTSKLSAVNIAILKYRCLISKMMHDDLIESRIVDLSMEYLRELKVRYSHNVALEVVKMYLRFDL